MLFDQNQLPAELRFKIVDVANNLPKRLRAAFTRSVLGRLTEQARDVDVICAINSSLREQIFR